jgi:hypothetical protein
MKLALFEGYNDLQFFRSFITKQIGGRVVTKENRNIIDQFKNLLAENPEMAKVEVISLDNNKIILLSIGSKNNFEIIAEGIKPLIDALRKDEHNISSILFVADKDAESEVTNAVSVIKEKLKKESQKINVKHILYIDYLEDLILEIVNKIKSPKVVNTGLLKNLLNIIEEQYNDDKYLHKRKVGIIHVVIGPRCFGHLFDEIFQFFDNPDYLIQHIDVLSEFNNWLME